MYAASPLREFKPFQRTDHTPFGSEALSDLPYREKLNFRLTLK